MDRLFNVEFAPLYLINDGATGWTFDTTVSATDYRILGATNQLAVSEHKLDLSGYTMDDLTVYFRNSFEQRGGDTFTTWYASTGRPIGAYNAAWLEVTVLSSVPLSDDNLSGMAFTSPGFITADIPTIDYGNFNRTQIIHGSRLVWQIDSSLSPNLEEEGSAYNVVIQSNDFSSLEPTAADCIYCYRFLILPRSTTGAPTTGLTQMQIPAKRVLLNATTDKEPEIEYLMRLKRSYELANQV